MGDLEPLGEILKGSDPSSPRHLTDSARQVLAQVEYTIQNQQVRYFNYDQPWQTYILTIRLTLTAVLWQNGPLLWLHLPVSRVQVLNPYDEAVACLLQKCLAESQRYFEKEPCTITVPLTKEQVDW